MKSSKKTNPSKTNHLSRRRFLSVLGLSAGAASVSSISLSSDGEDKEFLEEGNSNKYRETEHIKTVYSLSRF